MRYTRNEKVVLRGGLIVSRAVYQNGVNRGARIGKAGAGAVETKKRSLLWLACAGLIANSNVLLAQPQSVPGIVAKRETDLLTYEDKIAAYDAEQAVLSQDWPVTGYDWQGPNGAYGTIIVQGSLPQNGGKRHCRRFIHIVHHANDGGANPTFQGVVCRDEGGHWTPR